MLNQKLAALLATALTAFLLVMIGGVTGGLAAHRSDPTTVAPVPASATSAVPRPLAGQDPLSAPDQAAPAASTADQPPTGGDGRWPGEREHHDEHDGDDD